MTNNEMETLLDAVSKVEAKITNANQAIGEANIQLALLKVKIEALQLSS